jgi:glyoxylase-like metal-dependent hydrolase (beta-lactamase superfamily II)
VTGAPTDVDLGVRCGDGTAADEPPVQVHALDPHTFVLRQSLRTDAEAPFVFLLLGNTEALLIDSGATADAAVWPLRATVDRILEQWLAGNPRSPYRLTLAHSHSHGDHILGDIQFADRTDTTVVRPDLDGVREFFGFDRWPDQAVTVDLGGRVVSVIGAPGHEASATVFHDPWTGILFTGDTVYPGRLYVEDMPQYLATLERLAAFATARPVTWLMGCHIEMSRTPGADYPLGAQQHPDEEALQMLPGQLHRLLGRAQTIAAHPGVHRFDDAVIYNGSDVVDAYFASAGGSTKDLDE